MPERSDSMDEFFRDTINPDLVADLTDELTQDKWAEALAKIQRSTTWKRIEEFLLMRREQLYTAEHTTVEAIWKREGALQEINSLLRRGPSVLLKYHQWKAQQ